MAILSEGSFINGLEEFEKLPLREQRRKMKEAMAKVWLSSLSKGCVACY